MVRTTWMYFQGVCKNLDHQHWFALRVWCIRKNNNKHRCKALHTYNINTYMHLDHFLWWNTCVQPCPCSTAHLIHKIQTCDTLMYPLTGTPSLKSWTAANSAGCRNAGQHQWAESACSLTASSRTKAGRFEYIIAYFQRGLHNRWIPVDQALLVHC